MRLQKPPNAQRNQFFPAELTSSGAEPHSRSVGKETPLFVPNFRAAQRAGKLLEFPYSLGIALVKEAARTSRFNPVRSV